MIQTINLASIHNMSRQCTYTFLRGNGTVMCALHVGKRRFFVVQMFAGV